MGLTKELIIKLHYQRKILMFDIVLYRLIVQTSGGYICSLGVLFM